MNHQPEHVERSISHPAQGLVGSGDEGQKGESTFATTHLRSRENISYTEPENSCYVTDMQPFGQCATCWCIVKNKAQKSPLFWRFSGGF